MAVSACLDSRATRCCVITEKPARKHRTTSSPATLARTTHLSRDPVTRPSSVRGLARLNSILRTLPRAGGEALRSSLSAAMATPSTSQPTPQRLAAIREQLSLLADYL